MDVQAEDTQSTFTFYSSDVSVGGGEEFEAGYASTESSEEPPEKIQRIEDWELHDAINVETDSADTASWSGEEFKAVLKDPSYCNGFIVCESACSFLGSADSRAGDRWQLPAPARPSAELGFRPSLLIYKQRLRCIPPAHTLILNKI